MNFPFFSLLALLPLPSHLCLFIPRGNLKKSKRSKKIQKKSKKDPKKDNKQLHVPGLDGC
jgi:hypothetical protein